MPEPANNPHAQEDDAGQSPDSVAPAGARRAHLGRGLDALFGESDEENYGSLTKLRQTRTVPVSRLRANPAQPRRLFDAAALDELVASVEAQGVLTPLLVRPLPDDEETFEIVAGERRWRAAQRARLHEVPVVVRSLDDRQVLEVGLVENIQRADLSAIEEAQAYARLVEEFSFTQEALAETVGKSRSHIANTLRLLDLPPAVRQLVESGALSAGHGRALLTAADPEALAKQVADKRLSVRETERLAKKSVRPAPAPSPDHTEPPQKDVDSAALERELAVLLGMKVTLNPKTIDSGTLSIAYSNLEQLDELLRRLSEL